KKLITIELKEVLSPDNPDDNIEKWYKRFINFINKWEKNYPILKVYHQARSKLYFNYLNYQEQIRRMIYTTN
ncbi:MAG: IS256 family transposase, partial [Bacteroidales bacterium]